MSIQRFGKNFIKLPRAVPQPRIAILLITLVVHEVEGVQADVGAVCQHGGHVHHCGHHARARQVVLGGDWKLVLRWKVTFLVRILRLLSTCSFVKSLIGAKLMKWIRIWKMYLNRNNVMFKKMKMWRWRYCWTWRKENMIENFDFVHCICWWFIYFELLKLKTLNFFPPPM